jgi:DnaK suppressor protein
MEERHAELLASLRRDLDDVEAAMKRLEEGTYGRCQACGAPLPAEQLEAEPTASRCPACR